MTGAVEDEIHNIINHIVVCQGGKVSSKSQSAKTLSSPLYGDNTKEIHRVGKILSEGLEIVTRLLTFRHPSHNIVACQAHPQP